MLSMNGPLAGLVPVVSFIRGSSMCSPGGENDTDAAVQAGSDAGGQYQHSESVKCALE